MKLTDPDSLNVGTEITIDTSAKTFTLLAAGSLLGFVGDTLITTQGVYIDDYDPNDVNRLVFTDQGGSQRREPFIATGTLNFNGFLAAGGTGYFRMYFTDLPLALDYGTAAAVTVDDATGVDIAGTIAGASVPFSFAYDSNIQGGRTAGEDAQVTVVAGNPGSAKPVVTTFLITRAVGQGISLVAEQDRAYLP